MLSMVWTREEQEPEMAPFQIQMSVQGTHRQLQHPLLSASSLGHPLLQSSHDAAGASDGCMHPKVHLLLATAAQLLL